MNKYLAAVATGALSLGFAAQAAPVAPIAVDYPAGALGTHAIAQQDWAVAEARIKAAPAGVQRDPGVLINLGEVYYRTGRLAAARDAWERALAAPQPQMVTLRNGRVASTSDVARAALNRFRMASAAPR